MADIGFTALTQITTIKKGASTASAIMTKYSDGSFDFTANGVSKRISPGLGSTEFINFMFSQINALV